MPEIICPECREDFLRRNSQQIRVHLESGVAENKCYPCAIKELEAEVDKQTVKARCYGSKAAGWKRALELVRSLIPESSIVNSNRAREISNVIAEALKERGVAYAQEAIAKDELIAEYHDRLGNLLMLFTAYEGFDYNVAREALDTLSKSPGLPITVSFVGKIREGENVVKKTTTDALRILEDRYGKVSDEDKLEFAADDIKELQGDITNRENRIDELKADCAKLQGFIDGPHGFTAKQAQEIDRLRDIEKYKDEVEELLFDAWDKLGVVKVLKFTSDDIR